MYFRSSPINETAPFPKFKPNPIGVDALSVVDIGLLISVTRARTESFDGRYRVSVDLKGKSSLGLRNDDSSFLATSSSSKNISIIQPTPL